ncbi:MAG: bifunctional alpha,alpha-trehalose-phosphate synthase (UDP-forming)/trehalose-phosphatase [Microbacteriaceae bacterium]|nr:bifunctional alpha,alpha-trehalose-phosphate synthase (UDP-forming)/trehalose-phosphatase [Microbacteriaceae bacterium]
MSNVKKQTKSLVGNRNLVVVSNRLPVDHFVNDSGQESWVKAPGGLVTAVEPIVQEMGCLWIGWAGGPDISLETFQIDNMQLATVSLSSEDIAEYYEGFSNGTIWPLYHDVITPPRFHREWWDAYKRVNQKFADRIAAEAKPNSIVWIHDYQLQLVPAMLREQRQDLTIAFFMHIPFPARAIFAQLPWRRQIVEGLLGADVIGFQRVQDANSFRAVVERYTAYPSYGNIVMVTDAGDGSQRQVLAQEFPISIDFNFFSELASREDIRKRASEIRADLGNPEKIILGVDRLDYTKGIHHRLKAYEELLADAETGSTVLVQVASPSRERVEAYKVLRNEIEVTVGRINGQYGSIGRTPVVYLHQGFSREEMAALYVAADVLLVTALRDGMNLVAKEYIASRGDSTGVLILSEFTGSADELRQALLVNPHDIEGLKAAIVRAVHMPNSEQQRRMTALRKVVSENDVSNWASNFLRAVTTASKWGEISETENFSKDLAFAAPAFIPKSIEAKLRRMATADSLTLALDFDGTLAPLVKHPSQARILPRAQHALEILQRSPGVQIALLTGRSLASIMETGVQTDGWIVSGSHGAELDEVTAKQFLEANLSAMLTPESLSEEEVERVEKLVNRVSRVFGSEKGVYLEPKPFGVAIHTRQVPDPENAEDILEAAAEMGKAAGLEVRVGKMVRELSIRRNDKGQVLSGIRTLNPHAPVLFIGDDVTDEDAFAVLKHSDLGIKVGAGESIASERVDSPEDVAAVLAMLAEYRTGITVGSM